MYCNWVVSGIVSNVYSIPASHEKEEGGGTVARGLSSTRSVAQLNPSSSAQPASQQPLCNQLSRSTTISIASIPITSLLFNSEMGDIKHELQYKRKVAKQFFRCMSTFVPPLVRLSVKRGAATEAFPGFGSPPPKKKLAKIS